MTYPYTLPARHGTYVDSSSDMPPFESRSLSNKRPSHSLRRSSVLLKSFAAEDKENMSLHNHQYSPTGRNCTGVKVGSNDRYGTLLPISAHDTQNMASTANRTRSDSGFRSPLVPYPCRAAPDSDELLAELNRNLHIDDNESASQSAERSSHARSASSTYPSPYHNTPRVQSPLSAYNGHKLSLSDLSRFGRCNDRLSNLRSSSPTSSRKEQLGETSDHDVVLDATVAISEWQDAARPFRHCIRNKYALEDGSELLPSDSLSQRDELSTSSHHSPTSTIARQQWDEELDVVEDRQPVQDQYDGAGEVQHPSSPNADHVSPAIVDDGLHPIHRSKRKASQFSLRSLTRSFTKRPRLVEIRE